MKEIHLFNLPSELYIKLNPSFSQMLFNLAKNRVKKWVRLAKILKTHPSNVYGWKDSRILFPIRILRVLTSFLSVEESEIEKNIDSIKFKGGFINHPELPIKISEKIGIVLACILGDGGVSRSGYEVHYANKIDYQVNSFLSVTKEVFGDVGIITDKIREDGVRTVKLSGVLGRILVKTFKIPLGKKIFYDFDLPDVVMNGNAEIRKTFLKRLFDDEGTVSKSTQLVDLRTTIEKNSKQNKFAPKRLLNLKYLLETFDIRSSEPKKERNRTYTCKGNIIEVEDWGLSIHDRRSLQLFAEKIGFDIDYKMRRLEKIINSYKLWETPKNESLNFFFDNVKQLVLENGIFTSKDLSKKTKRSLGRTNKILKKLQERNLIRQVDNKIRNRNFTIVTVQ